MQQYAVSQPVRTIAMGIGIGQVFIVPEYENALVDSYNWIPVVPQTLGQSKPLDYISYISGSDVVMLAEW